MEDFINQETTINFYGGIKMDSTFRKYDESSKFTIIRQTKGGKYLLKDENNKEVILPKRNIEFFHDSKPQKKTSC